MKIALIFLCSGNDNYPPINLVSIASFLKHKDPTIEVKIFDSNFDNIDNSLEQFKPDLIGITGMSIEYTKIINNAKKWKQRFNIPIIIGGTHISILPDSLDAVFDVGIVGEGETTMLELISHFKEHNRFDKNTLNKIDGVVYYNNGKLIKTKNRELIDLEELPKLDWSLINPLYFNRAIAENDYTKVGFLMSARGCPYKCRYCSSSYYWKVCRYQSADQIMEEIKDLHNNYGIKNIRFSDDLFCYNLDRIKELTKLMEKEKLLGKIEFCCNLRANLVNDEMLSALKELGVNIVGFGFESGSEKYLAYLKRNTVTVEQNKKAIKLCKKYGMRITGSLMFGGPNETIEDMEKTLDFIDYCIKEKIENLGTFVVTPFPGTEMWDIAKERGKVSDNMDDWSKIDYVNVEDAFLLDDSIDKTQFKKIFQRGREKLGYFRKKRLLNLVLRRPIRVIGEAFKNPGYTFNSSMRIILNKPKEGK